MSELPHRSSTDVEIRPYAASDALATFDVFYRAVHETAIADYSSEQVAAWAPASVDITAWDARRRGAHTFVAIEGEQVLGFIDLTPDGLIDMLFVHPDAARRGVARALFETVRALAITLGIERLYTHASRTARPAFERFGFTVTRENHHNQIRGQSVPNFDMSLELTGRTTFTARRNGLHQEPVERRV